MGRVRPIYDWENARTLGRRTSRLASMIASTRGPILELGCGTAACRCRSHAQALRSSESFFHPRSGHLHRRLEADGNGENRRGKCHRLQPGTPLFVRGDIRALPFAAARFSMVVAPYGVLQSLLGNRDLHATLESVHRVLVRAGIFGIDLVPDVPNWREYNNKVQLRGRRAGGSHLTLIESVRQDRRRRLTLFSQRYVERRGTRQTEHHFDLAFRTLSVPDMVRRLERAQFRVEAVLGDYRGRAWDERADVWIIMARRA